MTTSAIDFDPTPYLRPPPLGVAAAVGLASRLLALLPRDAPADVKKRGRALHKATVALQKAWAAVIETEPPDRRPADAAVDTAWRILHDRLEAYGLLPADRYPRAARAKKLTGLLFPDGLDFTQLRVNAEWAESDKRLKQIQEQDLARELDALCGPECLENLQAAHAAYGEVLGMTQPREPEAAAPDLAAPLRQVTRAISRYVLSVCNQVDEDDPATVQLARRLLAPIDEHRAAQTGSRGGATSGSDPGPTPAPATPTTPIPDPGA